MKCPRCQKDNPPHAEFCLKCGAPLDGLGPIPESYAELKGEVERLRRSLGEALEQQTATSEILRVISSSPTDVQPVFDAILRSGVTLCNAVFGAVFRLEGDLVHLVGVQHPTPEVVAALYPASVDAPLPPCRALRDNAIIHVHDTDAEGALPPEVRRVARLSGQRSLLIVPMRREGSPIGAILVARPAVGRFPDEQIALLQTFADQAVIAIENVRLFNETKEALERQTATSEILRVISTSPSDALPVFDAIAQNAMRVCDGNFCNVVRYDGDLLHLAARASFTAEGVEVMERLFPMRPSRATAVDRAVLESAVVHLPDLQRDTEYNQILAAAARGRSAAAVPLLHGGQPIGAIVVGRSEARPFSPKQITLLQTFADQAVIAIENVRLFTELQEKNRALTQAHAQVTKALEQQTATSEILKIISASPTDVQPVFDAIAANARRLLRGHTVAVTSLAGRELQLMSYNTMSPAADAVMRAFHPILLDRVPMAARTVRERTPAIVSDIETDPAVTAEQRAVGRARGFGSFVADGTR